MERDHHTLKRIVSVSHRTAAAKVTAELNIHLEDRFHNFTNSTSMVELHLLKLLITESSAKR
jgi:hypothetical protein